MQEQAELLQGMDELRAEYDRGSPKSESPRQSQMENDAAKAMRSLNVALESSESDSDGEMYAFAGRLTPPGDVQYRLDSPPSSLVATPARQGSPSGLTPPKPGSGGSSSGVHVGAPSPQQVLERRIQEFFKRDPNRIKMISRLRQRSDPTRTSTSSNDSRTSSD